MTDRSSDHARSSARPLMMLSTVRQASAQADAEAGLRPWPEYLVLERDHDVELLDRGSLRGSPSGRGGAAVLAHTLAGLRHGRSRPAILSDGEHVGLPLAAALSMMPRRPRHVVIAHHLNTAPKARLLRIPRLTRGIDAYVVHSQTQREALIGELGLPPEQVHLVPFGIDTQFWAPAGEEDERLIVSSGREHRDYRTLAAAVDGLDAEVFVADGSAHSPAAHRQVPNTWPANIERGVLSPADLREKSRRAAIVVVPVVETDFPAGITVIAEAMALGKPVVVTGTVGLRGAIGDPDAVVTVPVGDAAAMRAAIESLLDSPGRRAELGARARIAAAQHHDVQGFSAALAGLLQPAGRPQRATASAITD